MIPPFAITNSPIDTTSLVQALANPGAGALVTFEGWARNNNDGQTVRALEYQAYAPLCGTEAARIFEEAYLRYKPLAILCRHRTGLLGIGDIAVWVGVVSPHRDEAFAACRYVIDQVKARLPIWKREHYAPDASGATPTPEWVNCARCASHGHPH